MKALLKDQKNTNLQKSVQNYTVDYYNGLTNWEGLYVANWDTKVLAYNIPAVIGKVMREGDRLKQLQDAMTTSSTGIYNTGIIVSPGSGKLCLSMYAPVYDGKTPIGYVGAGVFNTQLDTILKTIPSMV